MLVEMMREQSDFRLRINGQYSIKIYSKELECDVDEVEQFIQDCIREEDMGGFGLFKSDGKYFWAESLHRRMEHRNEIRQKRAEAGKKGAMARWQTDSKPMAGKERKGKESFAIFWHRYPRKVAKQKAMQVWLKLSPDEKLMKEIMDGLEKYIKSDGWKRDDGRYIPHPTTFLNQRRWEDEIDVKQGWGRF